MVTFAIKGVQAEGASKTVGDMIQQICDLFLLYNTMINLDEVDPDWGLAKQHAQANKVGKVSYDQIQIDETASACRCCYEVIEKDPLGLCENSKELQFLGFGYPLFYTFLKNCIMMLILSICTYSIFLLKKSINSNQSFCSEEGKEFSTSPFCSSWMIQCANKKNQVDEDEVLLRVVGFIAHFLFLIYMRDNLVKLEAYYDEKTTSLSDFTVMIKSLPKVQGPRSKIKEFFQAAFSKTHFIKKLILLPNYQEIDELESKKMGLVQKMKAVREYSRFDPNMEEFVSLKKQIAKINSQIFSQIEKEDYDYQNDKVVAERAIICFNTESEKDEIVQEFKSLPKETLEQYFDRDCESISLKEAPEPREIIWPNIGIEKRKKIIYYLTGWALSALTLGILIVIIYFLLKAKTDHFKNATKTLQYYPDDPDANQEYFEAKVLTYIVLFLIIILSKEILSVLFRKFTTMERHNNVSKSEFSFALKYSFGLFFIISLSVLIVEGREKNFFSTPFGVLEEGTLMLFINGLLFPLAWLINPSYIIRRIKRGLQFGKRSLTQRQANQLLEDPEYRMGERYAFIISTLWLTYFYSSVIPIGPFISLAGLIIFYWVDKYNLLRRSSIHSQISSKLLFTILILLDITLIVRCAGELIFDIHMRENYQVCSGVLLGISIVYFLLPIRKILDLIYDEKFKPESQSFHEVGSKFIHTYASCHPVLRKMKIGKNMERLKKLGLDFESVIAKSVNHNMYGMSLPSSSKNIEMERL